MSVPYRHDTPPRTDQAKAELDAAKARIAGLQAL